MWTFDISTPQELRSRLRKQMGFGEDATEEGKKADEEMEEWVASVLSRRDWKALGELENKPWKRDEGGKADRDLD